MLPKALKAKNNVEINKKYDTYYRLNKELINDNKFNETQQKIIDMFNEKDLISRKELLIISSSSLKTLVNKNILFPKQEGCISLKINFQTVFCGFCRKNRGGNLAKAKPATNHLERKLLRGKSYGHNYESDIRHQQRY